MNEELRSQPNDLEIGHDLPVGVEDDDENGNIVEKLHELPIMLIEKEGKKIFEDVQAKAPGKKICFCDAYIEGVEDWKRDGVGFVRENVLAIDHHMPLDEMKRNVSTTNLAIEYVKTNGVIPQDTVVMITHTDCDSVLSAAIMRGILPPKDEFGVAAVTADHTGEPNQIGDLVQSLEQDENGQEIRDLEFSYRNIALLLAGKDLEPRAKELVEKRYRDREKALRIVEEGFKTTDSGKVSYSSIGKKIDAGFLPALLPGAEVILLFCDRYDKITGDKLPTYEAKVRLGLAAPDGTSLEFIKENVDPNWGGRWDAGSNNRYGGTEMDVETYAKKLDQAYQEYQQSRG